MKLSTKGRYAMVALCDIALQPRDELVTLSDISRRQDISLAYLEQLFVKLRRSGLVESVRGPGGDINCLNPPMKFAWLISCPRSMKRLTRFTKGQGRRAVNQAARPNPSATACGRG